MPEAPEQPTEASNDLHSLYYSAHLPIDRRLAQDLDQANRLFSAGRYSEGLPLVDRVLEADEDTFELTHRRPSTSVATSLKLTARRMLASLPPAGVAALELDQGVRARRALDAALQTGSIRKIAAVAERYPVTQAAAEAMLIFAQAEIDAGRFDAAAALYAELKQWPKAKTRYGPLLAIRLVECYHASGNRTLYNTAVTDLKQLSAPSERNEIARLIGTNNLESWISQFSKLQSPATRHNGGWLIEGRDATRNPICSDGGIPHVWPAWEARTIKEIHVASRLRERIDWQQRHGTSWGLVASPIAVGNCVVVRTPTSLVAIDWRSGRRVWETRPEAMEDDGDSLNVAYQISNPGSAVALNAIDQRVWMDAVYGALSSDGHRVFAIRDLQAVRMRGNRRFGIRAFGRLGVEPNDPTNILAAYDLRTEGKLLWQVGGSTGPEMKDCFFLGAPLAVGNSLFLLAELANSIHLLQLDPTDGSLEWKQPLVNLERGVGFDAGRRLAGATPSYGQGLVLCPTGAGSVVAVDPVARSLAWTFRFEVDPKVATRKNSGFPNASSAYSPTIASRWHRNRAIVAGGSVLVTASECEHLYCLNSNTGEKRWSVDRDNYQYLAGVAKNRVVMVGDRFVSLLDLASGETIDGLSRIGMPNGATVAGLAVLADDQLIVPLSGNCVTIVDLANGKVQQTVAFREGHSIGNLAFHRGTLLSQSATTVTRFDQLSTLRTQLANSKTRSAQALRIRGELAWGEDDLDQAIEFFRQAYELEPEDAQVRRRFSSVLFAALRTDYDRYRKEDTLLTGLVSDASQRIALLRLHIDGSLAAGDHETAFDYATKLYAIDREGLVELDDGSSKVQSERWFAARLARIWKNADAPMRKSIAERIKDLTDRAIRIEGTTELSKLVSYFGVLPAARIARMTLAREWVASNRVREAELLLLQPDPDERLARWSKMAGTQPLAIAVDLLPNEHPRRLAGDDTTLTTLWPDGRVAVDVDTESVSAAPSASFASRSQSRNRSEVLLIEPTWCGVPWSGAANLAVSYGAPAHLLGWNELGEPTHMVPLLSSQLQHPNSNAKVQCYRFGHFAVLGTGREVAAIDLRSGPKQQSPTIWTSDAEAVSQRRTIRAVPNQGRPALVADQSVSPAGPSGQLCCASPLGVVVRNGDTLRCFDVVDGDLLWQRRGVPSNGPTFGDWQHVFLIAEGERAGVVIDVMDGSTVGNWQNPEGKAVGAYGRIVVTSQYRSGKRHVRAIDVLTGELLIERTYSGAAKLAKLAPALMGWMEPDGRLEVLDLDKGTVRFTQSLLEAKGLEGLHLLAAGNLIIVATNTRTASQRNSNRNGSLPNSPLVTGHVYALDSNTGSPRWERPAAVKDQGLWLLQPSGSPALVFISQKEDHTSNQRRVTTRLLCLDKRNGRSLVRKDRLQEPESKPWSMRIDHSGNPKVSIDLWHTMVTLRFTDEPRPPEPVALADVESNTRPQRTGLISIGRRIFENSFPFPPPPPAIDDDD